MGFFLMVWAISSLGFLGLAAAMDKHQKQFFAQPLNATQTNIAKWGGWVFIAISLIIAIAHYQIADGISYWVGVLSFAALFVLAMLSYFSQYFKHVVIILTALVVIGLILAR